MKRWALYISVGMNVVLAVSLTLALVPDEPELVDLSVHTQQDLEKAFQISAGMPNKQVLAIMGQPALKEISTDGEEWHYCKTGHSVDEYVAIDFRGGKVVGLHNYTVSWLDVVFHHTQTPTEALIEAGGMGDCKLTAKWGTYSPNYSMQPTAKASAD